MRNIFDEVNVEDGDNESREGDGCGRALCPGCSTTERNAKVFEALDHKELALIMANVWRLMAQLYTHLPWPIDMLISAVMSKVLRSVKKAVPREKLDEMFPEDAKQEKADKAKRRSAAH